MPIKEEPVRIEFQYEPDDAKSSNEVFNIEYFVQKEDGDEKKFLKISQYGSDEPSILEVDLLVEIVDFLRGKGVIGKKVDLSIPEGPIPRASSLPLPKVQLAGSPQEHTDLQVPDVDAGSHSGVPLSTFVKNGVTKLVPPIVNTAVAITPKIISAATADEMPIISRPVIRTRIGENEDPMKALEQSKLERQKNQTVPAKSIKRREAADMEQEVSEV